MVGDTWLGIEGGGIFFKVLVLLSKSIKDGSSSSVSLVPSSQQGQSRVGAAWPAFPSFPAAGVGGGRPGVHCSLGRSPCPLPAGTATVGTGREPSLDGTLVVLVSTCSQEPVLQPVSFQCLPRPLITALEIPSVLTCHGGAQGPGTASFLKCISVCHDGLMGWFASLLPANH